MVREDRFELFLGNFPQRLGLLGGRLFFAVLGILRRAFPCLRAFLVVRHSGPPPCGCCHDKWQA